MYNDTVLDHFANPRNVGNLADADGIGRSGNPADGDNITIYIKVRNETLYDVRFKTFGCGAAIAASSMLTVLAMGKSIEDGMTITNDDVAEALGGLPPQKLLCSNIAADALHAAIDDYLNRDKQDHIKCESFPEKIAESLSDSIEINHGLTNANQIQRYLRHIIMPQISGIGQKKLLECSVLIYAQSIDTCDVLLNYMTASGIGHIYCYLESTNKCESVLAHVHDLNPDTNIELIEGMDVRADFNVIIGDFSFAARIGNYLIQSVSHEFSPTLITAAYPWQGYVKLCNQVKSVKEFLAEVTKKCGFSGEISSQEYFQQLGMSISYAFMGTLMVTELIKIRLNIGNMLNDTFYFNLWQMIFINNSSVSENNFQNLQYSSHDLKQSLAQAKALIVGTGGLGCPAALALTKAGIGTIGLIDFDNVELSNLNRQILHTTSNLGMLKVESAKQTLKTINQNIKVDLYPSSFSRENAAEIIKNYDIIIDGLDNLPTRYLLNDACFFEKKSLIEAGALAFYGQVTTIVPGDGPCYRCIFPESTVPFSAPSCSETGVLGPVPGLMGLLQAVEVIKMIIGADSSLKGRLLMYDALETELNIVEYQRNNDCELCGDNPTILELGEYTFVCRDRTVE
jgi:molybdopterin/thiamine biosynthesis adenylyltransferase/NifU-like protein involved in Fe-S cluster formation